MTEPLIRLRAVTKTFSGRGGAAVNALDQLDLDLATGEFAAVIGPSGSGKSTLLFTIGALTEPSAGSVHLGDTNIYELAPRERALLRQTRIGFMFQTFNLMSYLDCRENVMLPALLAGFSKEEAATEAGALLQRLGLGHRIEHRPAELSVGERQRVALARSLVNRPQILLADEPTGNLDPAMTEEIIGLLKELNAGGQTILMVTHDHRLAERTKRVIKLKGGRIEEAPLPA